MAPEALMHQYSTKSDVWSFGIFLWEMWTGQRPHNGRPLLDLAIDIRDNHIHPEIPKGCDPTLASIMEKCWKVDPNERYEFPFSFDVVTKQLLFSSHSPTFSDIVQMLREANAK